MGEMTRAERLAVSGVARKIKAAARTPDHAAALIDEVARALADVAFCRSEGAADRQTFQVEAGKLMFDEYVRM